MTPPQHPGHYQHFHSSTSHIYHQIIQNTQRNNYIAAVLASLAAPSEETPGLLLQALVELEAPDGEGCLVRMVAQPWFEIARHLQSNPGFLYEFAKHSRRFEEFLAACYKQDGWEKVELTRQSGDGGIDVVICATLPGVGAVRFVDQAKAYSPGRTVSANDVRALYGVVELHPEITKGIITTTSTFAPGVEEEFKGLSTRLELKDGPKLLAWLDGLSKPE